MANSTGIVPKITAEDVISKLKDDGDFDKLRLKIVRKLKDNVDLRSNIISMIRPSAALNQPGAENMKHALLCDAVHEEIREIVMKQISDGLWEIIRSQDGLKTEITDTVHTVYDKLINPQARKEAESAMLSGQVPNHRGPALNGSMEVSPETGGSLPGVNPNGPTPYGPFHETHPPQEVFDTEDGDPSVPPGFSALAEDRLSDCGNEDPDVPPGFG
ncbi:hypothetical protein AKJ16_DCAP03016 [Drosera capensis]